MACCLFYFLQSKKNTDNFSTKHSMLQSTIPNNEEKKG